MIHKSFELMGRPAKDAVTGITGVVDSICFDLYGCIQASLRPDGLDDKGQPKIAHWFDVKRLTPTGEPVLPLPDFSKPEIGSAAKMPR